MRDREADVVPLLGNLELHMETASAGQIPNRRARDGYERTAPDCGDRETAASGGERATYHYYGYRADLAAAENTRHRRSHLRKILSVSQRVRLQCFPRLRPY